jgi:hypothetical protein
MAESNRGCGTAERHLAAAGMGLVSHVFIFFFVMLRPLL